jgi:hypothetical protein
MMHTAGLLPDAKSARILTDFTSYSNRLIFEEGYDRLQEFEQSLGCSMSKAGRRE